MRKIVAIVIVFAMLFTSLPVSALEMSDIADIQGEEALRAAIRGDELWVNAYPNGLFNFVGTQYVVNENNKFLEIAIARQGGTSGDVSIDFKAIDISAEYGKDYVIRVYENSKKMELEKDENAVPLIKTIEDNPELNISEPNEDSEEEEAEETEDTNDDENTSESEDETSEDGADNEGSSEEDAHEEKSDDEEQSDSEADGSEDGTETEETAGQQEAEESSDEQDESEQSEETETQEPSEQPESNETSGSLKVKYLSSKVMSEVFQGEAEDSEEGNSIEESEDPIVEEPKEELEEETEEVTGEEGEEEPIQDPAEDPSEEEENDDFEEDGETEDPIDEKPADESETDNDEKDSDEKSDDSENSENNDNQNKDAEDKGKNPDKPKEEQKYTELEPGMVEIGGNKTPKASGPLSLKKLKEATLKEKSDRPDWRTIDHNTIEQLKAEYDEFFYSVPGTETTIEFKDGEYIKYLYIIPLDDDISESEEQILFALTNPTGGAVRGEFYMAYANIVDDEPIETSTFEIVNNYVIAENGKAKVVVRRTGGIARYASVYVGTEEGSAIANADYVPGLEELLFTPGMTEQTVTVNILHNSYRTSPREFKIALDRTNENVNLEKAEAVVLVPAIDADESVMRSASDTDGLMSFSPQASISSITPGVERISSNGWSPGKGQWYIVSKDLVSGHNKGWTLNGYNLTLRAKGTDAYARVTNVKLYGVQSVTIGMGNSGCGYHWTQREFDYDNSPVFWRWFGLGNPAYKTVSYSQHEFRTSFGASSAATNSLCEMVKYYGNLSYKTQNVVIPESLWNTTWVGYYTWAAANNQSTASLSAIRLNLKPYTITVYNDTSNVPNFQLKQYEIQKRALKQQKVILTSQPGSMSIKSVLSNVNNAQPNLNKTSTTVYRSDKIEFNVSYANNEIGKNSTYVGFEVYTSKGWKRYSGTTLSLDKNFFAQAGVLEAIKGGTIKVRPVFEQKTANISLQVDTHNGYLIGLGERIEQKSFTGLKTADVISANAKNYNVSVTPSWSANNNSAITSTDSTGANTSVNYKLSSGSNWLRVDFVNPTLIVQANPNVYSHRVTKPTFTIDGVKYTKIEDWRPKIEEAFNNNSNPMISISFSYEFDKNYPDPNNVTRALFGTPQEAVLTVYRSDGSVREMYPSVKKPGSPTNYEVEAKSGTYTFSGRLRDLGWEDGDFATVIIYGSRKVGDQIASTRETIIDFLTNDGSAVVVEKPDGNKVAGDIYNPIVIEKADPIKNYNMIALLNAGFVAKWKDYSGDLDGDGQVSSDEYHKLEKKMKAYGMNLSDIYTNANYRELFWGNFFSYVPKFFNPSKILYNFEKKPTGTSLWTAAIIVKEVYSTVLNPNNKSQEMPIKGATVIVGDKEYKTDDDGIVSITDPMFQEGNYYLARIMHKGYEFYTYVQPGSTVKHVFDTSDIMRPFDFKAYYEGEDLKLDAYNTLVPVRNGDTVFKFKIDNRKEGIAANDAYIRIYKTNEAGYRTGDPVYEKRTGKPSYGEFTHSIDLLAQGIRPGYKMVIAPLHIDENGNIEKEYPEVDVGLTFSMELTVVSALASFDTPLQPAVEFIGKLNNAFDLGFDIDMDDITKPGTRVDENGVAYNTKIISFGFNKDFEKEFGDQAEDDKEKKDDKKTTDKLKEKIESSGNKKSNTKNTVKEATEGAKDKENKSVGGSFKFEFGISLALTIEEGQKVAADGTIVKDGYYYFSSMVLMAEGSAELDVKATYVTPIGIPVFASLNVSGNAFAVLAIEANASNRYAKVYQFSDEGTVSLNPTDYSIYAQFFVSPSITIGAGVGVDLANVFVEGNATVDLNFTAPITSTNQKSSGSGELTISAAVGIKILFIQKKWTLYQSNKIPLFSYGTASDAVISALSDPYKSYMYESVTTLSDDDILPRDYLENTSEWLPNEKTGLMSMLSSFDIEPVDETKETILKAGVYPYPQTKMVPFGDGKLLVLFVGDPGREVRDDLNRAQLFYTIYDGSSWSEPQAVDTDKTWDEAPDAFVVEDKILVTWADASRVFTSQDTAKIILSEMNISAKWFDISTGSFGEEFPITQNTTDEDGMPFDVFADINPKISYDPATERLMVYCTKIDYNLNEEPDGSEPYEYDTDPIHDEDAKKPKTDDGEETTVYGDIVNGYSVIAFRYAEKQEDGSFEWNKTYGEDSSLKFPVDEALIDEGITQDNFYGQRLLDLAVLVDIEEEEMLVTPEDPPEDPVEDTPEWDNRITGTKQVVKAAAKPIMDPLVLDSDLFTYNGLALYTYVMDADGSKSTTNDQEIYMQIYNYELNEFHHPIRLTNNDVQDSKPQFVRTKDITYLYWLSGGDIVYMDITNLVKHKLAKHEVEIEFEDENEEGGKRTETRSIYIVDKSKTSKEGFTNVAVESRPDYPIEDFRIQSNGVSEYLIWTDYVISYKNGLKAGDPGTEDPKNIIKEKQMFAVYREPQVEYSKEQVFDHYQDIEGKLKYKYAEGKGPGTYPVSVEVLEDMEYDDQEIEEGTIIVFDYRKIEDINGYKGVVKAGDPVLKEELRPCEGFEWSKPIQLTKEKGANYSDISFIVDNDDNIRAVYVKYGQELNDDENPYFTEDISNRTFATSTFRVTSTVEVSDITLSAELPLGDTTLNLSANITNTGLKALTEIKYVAYMKQNGKEIAVIGPLELVSSGKLSEDESSEGNIILSEEQQNNEFPGQQSLNILLGGDTVKLNGAFMLPEDITNITVGYKILDKYGSILKEREIAVRAEPKIEIGIINSMLKDKNTASLSLYLKNVGNLKHIDKLVVSSIANDKILKVLDLVLDAGEEQILDLELDIKGLIFGDPEENEFGEIFDKAGLKISTGEFSTNAEITRKAEKAIADAAKRVKSFTVDKDNLTLNSGKPFRLNANTVLDTLSTNETGIMGIMGEETGPNVEAKCEVKWTTSNPDVASVLPDGTIIPLSPGKATITATLVPMIETTTNLYDGTIVTVDNSYKIPESLIQVRTVEVTVAGETPPVDEPRDEPEQPVPGGTDKDITGDKEEPGQPEPIGVGQLGEIKQSDISVVMEFIPEISLQTSIIAPSATVINDALAKMKDANKSELTFAVTGTADKQVAETEKTKLVINNEVLGAIVASEVSTLTFETPLSKMSIGKETIDELKRLVLGKETDEKKDVAIQVSKVNAADYPDELKKLIRDLPVYDFSIMVGDKQLNEISDTPISVTLKLDVPDLEPSINENQIAGAYITEDGKYKLIPLSAMIDGKLVIKTTHNSVYGGLHNKVEFKDVTGWSEDYIAFLSARGIINGKGDGRFAPKDNITRGEFVKIMAMVADADVSTYKGSSFKDVDANKWYAPYIEWAYKNGLVNGIGGGMFAPDRNILREEMAVLLSRFAEKIEFTLPELQEEIKFKDNPEIAEYARTSVKLIQKAGIVSGRPDGTFAPKDNASREEAAKVFTELIKTGMEQ